MIIWIIGLSGAGKSTIGRRVCRKVKHTLPNTVLVDGDEIRELFKFDTPISYSLEGRKENAERIISLCKFLDNQNINVICAILSVFEEHRRMNRTRFSKYFEVFIDADLDALKERDYKGIYQKSQVGKMENVVGMDIPFQRPEKPHLVIKSGNPPVDANVAAELIVERSNILL